jgi:pyrroloquinoline quinone (PQQ) biosynthesis protein C
MHEQQQGIRAAVEQLFTTQVAEFTDTHEFRALEDGSAGRAGYDAFIANVARAHLASPQLVAFLYALAPPAVGGDLLHNLLEELGLDDGGPAHPALLRDLLVAAGLGDRIPHVEALAAADLRRAVVEPLLHGTLRDVGLAALGEIVAFEYMLSRTAGRIARALAAHRRLPEDALRWFTHHSEVDLRHAEQGLAALDAYVRYYDVPSSEALAILEVTLRENVFARRYFRDRLVPAGAEPAR